MGRGDALANEISTRRFCFNFMFDFNYLWVSIKSQPSHFFFLCDFGKIRNMLARHVLLSYRQSQHDITFEDAKAAVRTAQVLKKRLSITPRIFQ
jgi:hypothetical protein